MIVVACSSGTTGESPVVDVETEDTSAGADGSSNDVAGDIGDTDGAPTDVTTAEDVLNDAQVPDDVPGLADASSDADPDASIDTSSTCGELAAAYNAVAGTLDQCSVGSDCTGYSRPVCGAGCVVGVNATADLAALEAAWLDFSAAGCVPETIIPDCCDLWPQWGFGCTAGTCTPCDYQCELDCTCKKDAAGCDIPECEPPSCAALTQAVDEAVKANDDCTEHADCQRFEHPICGSIGCYQRAVSTSAPMEQLSALALAAQEGGCEPFECGCDVQGEPLCVDGTCMLCPGGPGCPASCDELRASIHAVAATGGACKFSSDCAMLSTPFCAEGKGLGCNALAVSGPTAVNAATTLLEQFADLKCAGDDCDCFPAEVPICKDGACMPFYYVQ
ncbi:MAG: hypothetical protein IV100_04140 [Myxococcales bacterium]|nr:hypothetical protein [Myxococcales bacterium]